MSWVEHSAWEKAEDEIVDCYNAWFEASGIDFRDPVWDTDLPAPQRAPTEELEAKARALVQVNKALVNMCFDQMGWGIHIIRDEGFAELVGLKWFIGIANLLERVIIAGREQFAIGAERLMFMAVREGTDPE